MYNIYIYIVIVYLIIPTIDGNMFDIAFTNSDQCSLITNPTKEMILLVVTQNG